MQAVIGDDPFDAAHADGKVSLPEFLGHDRHRSVWIQKTMAEDLAHNLLGAAEFRFGAGLLRGQSRKAPLLEGLQQLIVTLAAATEFLSDLADARLQALAFQKHEKAPRQLIVGSNGQ